MKKSDLTRDFFDQHADVWYRKFAVETHDFSTYPNFRLPKSIAHLASLVEIKTRAVDIGCGGGIAFRPLADIGFERIDGLDFSSEMVALARQTVVDEALESRVRVSVGNMDDLYPEENLFDGALALGLACYQDDIGAFLRSVERVLKPGGVVCLDFRNKAFNLFSTNGYTTTLSTDEIKDMIDEFSESVRAFKPGTDAVDFTEFTRLVDPNYPLFAENLDGNELADTIIHKDWKLPFNMNRTQHTPREIRRILDGTPLRMVACDYVHFHPFPPVFGKTSPQFFNSLGSAYESLGQTPFGFTQASTFVAVLRKAA